MKIVDRNDCQKKLKKSNNRFQLNQGQICAIGNQAIQQTNARKNTTVYTDACQGESKKYILSSKISLSVRIIGDSGGPLQSRDEKVHCVYHVVGVISFGLACGNNIPSLYTSVPYYLDWIEKNVWPEEF